MINPTRVIEITATEYWPQFVFGDYKYDNSKFYSTTKSFKEMCVKKYDGTSYRFSLHPFRVVML